MTTKTPVRIRPEVKPDVNPQREPVFDPDRLCPKQVERIGI